MNAFHPWELAPQGPVARKVGEIVAAEFTNGSAARPAQLSITRIANGRRERVATYSVSNKREARTIAAQLDAQPWNF